MHMRSAIEPGTNTFAITTGVLVIILAISVLLTEMQMGDIANWAYESIGASFPVFLLTLTSIAIFCWLQINGNQPSKVAYVTGVHAANGITTLALTYTLFGISMGIGAMAQTPLSPETVSEVISDLTKGFQLAFMTTVIGLPISAILRAVLQITASRVFSTPACQSGR